MNLKPYLAIFIIMLAFSCDSFKKVQESTNYEYKYEMAKKYYDKGDYEHASELYKELMQIYRGTQKSELIFYYWVYCDYHLEDYLFAAHQFRRFVQAFPRSQYAEEIQYMIGVCYMKFSPAYYLDQEYTHKAIDEFQLFLDKYPKGTYSAQANESVDKLQVKLEQKGFETVNLYHKIGEYKSCIVTGEAFCNDFPDSKMVEKVRLMMVESAFNYASQSIEEKQLERFKEVIVHADKFISKYPDAKKLEDAVKFKSKSIDKLSGIKYNLPKYYFEKADYKKAMNGFEELLKANEFKLKRNELTYFHLKSQYLYAQSVEADKKSNELVVYRSLFEKAKENVDFAASSYYSELERDYHSAEKAIAALPSQIADEYYDMLNFEKAAKYYFAYAAQSVDKGEQQKYVLRGLESKLKEAEKANDFAKLQKYEETLQAYSKWEGVLVGSASVSKGKAFYEQALAAKNSYPLALFQAQYKKEKYSWVKLEAKKQLDEGKVGEFQDEIVYLSALSEYKSAKKSEKYERKAQYDKALEVVKELKKRSFKKPQTLQKLEELEAKMNAKIEKLKK
ncbi:MAG: outer membrane protein assembly factor BamD [Flavobacteriales bacterium]